MVKKINYILNIIMGSFTGVFLGHGIYVFWDYKTHPDLYAAWSAPGYTSILVHGIMLIVVLAVAVIIKLMLHRKR